MQGEGTGTIEENTQASPPRKSSQERAVGAFSASMAPAASRALQARQSSWQRPRRLPLGCRTHPGLAASLPPPRAALRTPRGRPRSLSHARLRPHHLALPKEGVLKRTLRIAQLRWTQFWALLLSSLHCSNHTPRAILSRLMGVLCLVHCFVLLART